MWTKTAILCLSACAALSLVVAVPIPDKWIDTSEILATSSDMDYPELKIQMPQGKGNKIELPVKLEKIEPVRSDRIKKRIKRSVMPKVCSKGEIRIGGVCMSCSDLGEC